jgi:hypothetical protein
MAGMIYFAEQNKKIALTKKIPWDFVENPWDFL